MRSAADLDSDTAGVEEIKKSPLSLYRHRKATAATPGRWVVETRSTPRNGFGRSANAGISFRNNATWPLAGSCSDVLRVPFLSVHSSRSKVAVSAPGLASATPVSIEPLWPFVPSPSTYMRTAGAAVCAAMLEAATVIPFLSKENRTLAAGAI